MIEIQILDPQTVMDYLLPDYAKTHPLSAREYQICNYIRTCRTEALGGMALHCDHCDYTQPWYHACRDRHCPKCQFRATEAWCEAQCQAVLPVTYYHWVFTLPHELNGWVELHPNQIYALFFKAVWAALKAFGADPKRLGGQLGVSAVLHTWGQQLWRHVHLPGEELIRRFLLHIIPKGFVRIRHYGFLANRCRKAKLAKIRAVLGQVVESEGADKPGADEHDWPCPKCHRGRMRVFVALSPITLSGR